MTDQTQAEAVPNPPVVPAMTDSFTLHDQQCELLSKMEPVAANTAVDVLATGGMQELALVSAAISARRTADMLTGFFRAMHTQGDLSDDELIGMGIQP